MRRKWGKLNIEKRRGKWGEMNKEKRRGINTDYGLA
jgi:hypothetical protein